MTPKPVRSASKIIKSYTFTPHHWVISTWKQQRSDSNGSSSRRNQKSTSAANSENDRLILTTYTSFWKQLETMMKSEEEQDRKMPEMNLKEDKEVQNEKKKRRYVTSDFERIESIQEQILERQKKLRMEKQKSLADSAILADSASATSRAESV